MNKDQMMCLRETKNEPVKTQTVKKKAPEDSDHILSERYKKLIENIPCAVYSAFPGKKGPTTFMSSQWKEWTGYSPEELYQDPQAWPKCIHPDDRAQAEEAYLKACRDGISYHLEYRVVHKDTGWVRYVRDQGVLGKNDRGAVVCVDGIVTDITRQKNAENELNGYRERLEALVDERTSEITKAYQALKRKDEQHDQAERALRESEELHRAILSSILDAVLITDSDGALTYVCPDIDMIFGYSREEVLMMKGIEELFGQTLLDEGMLENDGEIRNIELDIKDKVGQKRSLLVNIKKVAIASGKNLYMCRDVTERKRAEREREAHLRFVESLDRINRVMHGTNDLDQIMTDVLDGMLDIFDCDRAIFMHPCDPKASCWHVMMERSRPEYHSALAIGHEVPMDSDVARMHQILLESNGPVRFGPDSENPLPEEMSTLFGSESQIFMALYPMTGTAWIFGLHQCSYLRVWTPEEGRLLQEIGRRLSDVLTSLLTHRDLRESERRFRDITENALEWIWEVDNNGKYTFVSPVVEKILGYKPEEVLNKYFYEFFHPDDRETLKNVAYQVFTQKRPFREFVNRNIHKNGKTVWLLTSGVPVFDKHKNLIGYRGADTDITERKRAEKALADYQEQLKSLASQLSLTEEREKHRLATRLHDQISQSLVVSKIKLDELRKSMPFGELSQTLDDISKDFEQLIDDSGTLMFEMSSPILHELGFETAVSTWLVDYVHRKHAIETEFEDDGQPKPLGKDVQAILFRDVRELLLNVIRHARAHTITVSIKRIESDICVRIEDDGIGFDPVEVAAMAAKKAGFGLFNIREGLDQLGGRITIESEPGCGSKIVLMAPLKTPPARLRNIN